MRSVNESQDQISYQRFPNEYILSPSTEDKCLKCDVHATCHNGRCRCRPGYEGSGYRGDCFKGKRILRNILRKITQFLRDWNLLLSCLKKKKGKSELSSWMDYFQTFSMICLYVRIRFYVY